jgi:hypothetical protein
LAEHGGGFAIPERLAAHSFFNTVGNPSIEALTGGGGMSAGLTMQLRSNAEHEFARTGLCGLFASLGAELQIIIDRILKRLPQLRDRPPLKRHDIPNANDLAVKDIALVVELGASVVAFEVKHGWMPPAVKKVACVKRLEK